MPPYGGNTAKERARSELAPEPVEGTFGSGKGVSRLSFQYFDS